MIYNIIPGTELRIAKAAVGAMSFGAKVDEAEAAKVISCAAENGINMLDTAYSYNDGESERILGKILPHYDRDQFVIASKVAYRERDGKKFTDLSREFIVSAVEESLRRMNIDYMDICYFHAPDYTTPLEESLEAMNSLVTAGKVRYFGVSNYAAWQIADMTWHAEKMGCARPIVTQNVYNMLSRNLDAELTPCVKNFGVGLVVFNPIAGGLLSGKHHGGKPAEGSRFASSSMYFDRYWNEDNFRAVERLTQIAEAVGMSLLEMALRWCVSQEHVTSFLLGLSRASQFEENVKLVQNGPLPAEVLKACDDVWLALRGHEVNYNR